MTEAKPDQKKFVPLFVLAVVADLVTRIALATGDEVWEHLSMLWLGPLDDVFFGLIGLQAFLYLMDPSGEKTIDDKGSHNPQMVLSTLQTGGEKELATNFVRGSMRALLILPVALVLSLLGAWQVSGPIAKGALGFSQMHLAYILPISLAVVVLFAVLRLGGQTSNYWKTAALAGACLFVAAAVDGRWQNHMYHMIANLENVMAWTVTFSWAGFFAAMTEQK
jgi:hypothetical protein